MSFQKDLRVRNVAAISLAFFFLFFGFATGQQYLTILLKAQGREHVALVAFLILYATFMVTGIFVSKIIPHLGGLKRSLIIGAATYVIFTGSVAFNSTPLLILSSFLIGVGAALVWVSSGQIIADSSVSSNTAQNFAWQTAGQYAGGIAGVYAVDYLIHILSLPGLYLSLSAVAASSVGIIMALKPEREELAPRPFKALLVFDARLLALFPITFGAYFLQGQMFTGVNTIVVSLLGLGSLPHIIAAFRGSNILGNLASGLLSRTMDKRSLLTCLAGIALFGVALFTLSHSFSLILAGSLLLGISMAAIYPVCLALIKDIMTQEEYLQALGVFHVYNNIGILCAIGANLLLSSSMTFVPGVIALFIAIPLLRSKVR